MGNAGAKSDGTTQRLIEAASKGDLTTLKDLLAQAQKAGTDVKVVLEKARGSFGLTALHEAAERGHLDVVRFLLSQGASLTALTDRQNTPLHIALRASKDDCGAAILQHALLGLNWQRIRLVFIGYKKGREDDCPFARIPKDVNRLIALEVMKTSVDYPTLFNTFNADNLRPIDYCARNNLTKSLSLLLRFGVSTSRTLNTNQQYANYTPLHFAAVNCSTEAARMLLAAGADVHALNIRRETPLARGCCAISDPEEVIKLLLEHGADPEDSIMGRRALDEAVARHYSGAVSVLKAAIKAKRDKGLPVKPIDSSGSRMMRY